MTEKNTSYDDFLGRIEGGELSPPLGALIKLGKALDMKMGFFLSEGEHRPYTIVLKDERQRDSRRASSEDQAYGYTYESLAPGKADRHMEPFLITLDIMADSQKNSLPLANVGYGDRNLKTAHHRAITKESGYETLYLHRSGCPQGFDPCRDR